MKRYIYIVLFVLLGLLVSTLVHVAIEWPLLQLVINDYEQYGQSYWWRNWELLHGTGGVVIWLLGIGVGYWCGVRYWRVLYEEHRYGVPRL